MPGGLSPRGSRTVGIEAGIHPDETATAVTADISGFDNTKIDLIQLDRQADGTYTAEFMVSVLNTNPNGQKAIQISAIDDSGNTATISLLVELNNPPPVLDAVPLDDDFTGDTLDLTRWSPHLTDASLTQNGRVIASVKSVPAFSSATVNSTWAITGGFDVQIDFQLGEG